MNAPKNLPDARVDADWIGSRINDPSVRLIEIDVSAKAYNAGHIPGAIFWNAYTDLRHADYLPVDAAELQNLLRKSGVTSEMTVVVYGYGAHLGYWLLKSHGHEMVRLMDGPREQWLMTGRNWSTDVPTPAQSQYRLATRDTFSSSREDVQAMIRQPNRVIIDTRSKAEYDGERFWPSGATEGAGRSGHIPGAASRSSCCALTTGRSGARTRCCRSWATAASLGKPKLSLIVQSEIGPARSGTRCGTFWDIKMYGSTTALGPSGERPPTRLSKLSFD
jgi:3-mercaptopyruvate sulfurtransferase SseA